LTFLSNLQPRAKIAAKAVLPKSVVAFISGCRYRGFLAHINYRLKLRKYRTQFAKANAALPNSTIVLPGDCRIQVPLDAEVYDAFQYFGWKEPATVEEYLGFMNVAAKAKILWDVGALFGFFSLVFALKSADRRALAFEPNPDSRAKLEECVHLNPTAQIEVFDFAVGLPGKVVEFEPGFHYTAVAESPARTGNDNSVLKETVAIKTMSIDELIEKNFAPPDIIKIDVEGHEFDVLQGARKLLLAKKPILCLELHPELLARRGTSSLAIAEYLEAAGYVLHDTRLKRVKKDFFNRETGTRIVAM
jgi:FkbM family methyltransferase